MSKKRKKQRGGHLESAASPPSVVAEPNGESSVTETEHAEGAALPDDERAQTAVELMTVDPATLGTASTPSEPHASGLTHAESPDNAEVGAGVIPGGVASAASGAVSIVVAGVGLSDATSTASGARTDSTPSAELHATDSAGASIASDAQHRATNDVEPGASTPNLADATSAPQHDVGAACVAPVSTAAAETGRSRWGFASRALKAAKKLLLVDETPARPAVADEPTAVVPPSHDASTTLDAAQAGATSANTTASAHAASTANEAQTSARSDGDAATFAAEAAPTQPGESHAATTDSSTTAPATSGSSEHAVAVSADASADAKPAFCGHSSVLAVPEVLGLLATLHKSGSFSVWNGHDAFRIRLVRGTVVSAQATASAHQLLLGTILVDHGAIAAQTLAEFMAHLAPERRLGDALVEAGLIERTTLESAVQYQAQRVFHAAYGLRDAWYRFDIDVDDSVHERGMSVTHLLLESARMRDETEQRLDDVLGDPFPDS
ncbi:MAG: DUF4388 domain-containing protein [Planctomycetes bacterium]|nr:DUF4388 domain-containing protein [Planctomycetota bacterium]